MESKRIVSFYEQQKRSSVNLFRKFLILILSTLLITSTITKECKQKDSLVLSLPNFSGAKESFPCIYSGFIQIDKNYNSQIFYVLLSKNEFEEDDDSPLTIWLNGGPGLSSLIGLFTEMGPLKFSNDLSLVLNGNTSWTRLTHLLLVDQPVGTGYSFIGDESGMPKNQAEASLQFYKFFQKFLTLHDDLSHKPVFLTGENYAGKYIPEITERIIEENIKIEKNESSFTHKINLKKILIGNGLFDTKYQRSARKDLAKGINLMSEFDDESQYDYLSQKCEFSLSNNLKESAKDCDNILNYLLTIAGDVNKYDVRKSSDSEAQLIAALEHYLNLEETVSALHVKNNTIKSAGKYFSFANETVKEQMQEDINFYSSLPKLEKILNNYEIPVILFAGQFDLVEGPQGLERAVHSLNFSFKKEFENKPRSLWKIPIDQNKSVIAGYIKQVGNLALITMRNAGHFAPLGRPGSMFDLMQHVLSDEKEWKCPDDKCSLAKSKCLFMNKCNGNGSCGEPTGGKCICNENFYGPDCSLHVESLTTGTYKILPRNIKLLHFDDFENDILLEVDSDDKNIVISLIDKNEHEYVYDIKKHQVAYQMQNKKLILYLEKDKFANSIIVVQNQEFKHEIEIKTYIDHYSKFEIFDFLYLIICILFLF